MNPEPPRYPACSNCGKSYLWHQINTCPKGYDGTWPLLLAAKTEPDSRERSGR